MKAGMLQGNCGNMPMPVCALRTTPAIWDHLAKVNLDVNDVPSPLSMWDIGYKYAYDSPPILLHKGVRHVPAHLLSPKQPPMGATHIIQDKEGIKWHIGDDGGIRRGNVDLFTVDCQPAIRNIFPSMWHDREHASFARASVLAKRPIVVIGDIHGDFKQMRASMRVAGLIGKLRRWKAKNTVFVQMVIQLLGNHEIMNVAHNYHYVHPHDELQDKGRTKEFAAAGSLGKRLYRLPLVYRVGNILFAHGGISSDMPMKPLYQINRESDSALTKIDGRRADLEHDTESVIGINGPAFFRDYSSGSNEQKIAKGVGEVLAYYGVERMIVGHHPQQSGKFKFRCGGRYIITDISISRYMPLMGGHTGALKISSDGKVSELYG
ncbi:Metallo-dependent phosphatase-like protein [Syncephalis pseudoplumigaleata]|uniref:Metallo-dependent phosphatase-like protein n=1 Tax=Syncephalis pseudoplumigaleata TaxID=1712513 RepID=A0A4P9YS77_9FUNG|nr:Metallo-dependent phosphatase-like protein [Syncephalis pseudoplumigaleata]|eukprot:RKP22555.1 Metallo-dependent phosphatase-like protein [Syncephalis pseudoplumigaleata]